MPYQQFQAPAWQTSRISELRQQFAAPQVGRLKRKMSPWMIGGGGPQRGQETRGTMRGYGEGLSSIMAGAGKAALSQYGQEYQGKLGTYLAGGGGGAGGAGGAMMAPSGQGYRTGTMRTPEQEEGFQRGLQRPIWARFGGGQPMGRQVGGPVGPKPLMKTMPRRFIPLNAARGLRGGRPTEGMNIKTQFGLSRINKQQYEKWAQSNFAPGQFGGMQIRESPFDIRQRAASVFGIGVPGLAGTPWKVKHMKPPKPSKVKKEVYLVGPQGYYKPVKRQKGGPVYKVGEKGPELVKYDSGHFEVVGKQGPEIRTFSEKGTVIPAGKTKKMLKSMYMPIKRQMGGRIRPRGTMEEEGWRSSGRKGRRWLPSQYAEMMGFVPRGSWFLSRSMMISEAQWERDQKRQNKLAIALAGARGGAPASPKAKKARFSFVGKPNIVFPIKK